MCTPSASTERADTTLESSTRGCSLPSVSTEDADLTASPRAAPASVTFTLPFGRALRGDFRARASLHATPSHGGRSSTNTTMSQQRRSCQQVRALAPPRSARGAGFRRKRAPRPVSASTERVARIRESLLPRRHECALRVGRNAQLASGTLRVTAMFSTLSAEHGGCTHASSSA